MEQGFFDWQSCPISPSRHQVAPAIRKLNHGISLDDNNAIFGQVCSLCTLFEERAFKDALQLGAHLILELQEK